MSAIYVTSVGQSDPEVLEKIEDCLARAFRLDVRRAKPFPEPEYAFDAKAQQYSAMLIVKELVRECPADAARFLAITEKDLFIPMLTFVFGQAQLGGTAAVVSLARLRQEFYRLPPDGALLAMRSTKEALHEMGHTFGLVHCPDPDCTMSLAINIRQLDRKGAVFCRKCMKKIRERISMLAKTVEGREVPR